MQRAAEAGLTDNYALEIGNEPDLAHPFYANHPEHFAEALRYSYAAARAHGFTGPIITGGITNLNQRGLFYLERLAPATLPADLTIGFHRYPEAGRGPLAPHDGFTSRDEEWDTLRQPRRRAPRRLHRVRLPHRGRRPHTLDDEDVAASVLWDLAFYDDRGDPSRRGLSAQRRADRELDRSLRRARADGTWKPVADAIRVTYGRRSNPMRIVLAVSRARAHRLPAGAAADDDERQRARFRRLPPSYQGYGVTTPGGRGGVVLRVTSLARRRRRDAARRARAGDVRAAVHRV